MEVQGIRRRGRPKTRWLDSVRDDIRDNGLSGEEVYLHTVGYIDTHRRHIKVGLR